MADFAELGINTCIEGKLLNGNNGLVDKCLPYVVVTMSMWKAKDSMLQRMHLEFAQLSNVKQP